MINKFYKTIHNKYSRFFRFIFFLRYLFGLFIVAIILFLIIPSFLIMKKNQKFSKNILLKIMSLKFQNMKA